MFRLLIALILLSACAPSDRNKRHFVDHAQMFQTVSRDTEVFRDGRDHVNVRAIILEKQGTHRYYLSLTVLRGGPNGPHIQAMQHNGKTVPYQRHDRLQTFCIDGCHKAEVGAITLTRAAFEKAAATGMTITIDGKRRDYLARVPSIVFANALSDQPTTAPEMPVP